jgi:hypothetical protein
MYKSVDKLQKKETKNKVDINKLPISLKEKY